MTSYERLVRSAARRSRELRKRRVALLRYLGESGTWQEDLAWDLSERLCLLAPGSFLFGELRVANERRYCEEPDADVAVTLVRVPVSRRWSPLWVIYSPTNVFLSKLDPADVFYSIEY